MTEDQVGLEFWPAEIEHAVLEAQLFGGDVLTFAPRDGNRRCRRGPHHPELMHLHFDLARGHRHVAGRLTAHRDDALNQHNRFGRRGGGRDHDLGRRPLGVARKLDQPVAVPQVEKDNPAKVAATMDPAAEANGLPDVGTGQGATAMGAK